MYDNLTANVPIDLWIGGKWRQASDQGRFDVIDPATENTIASVASATVEDAKAAVDAASLAFEGWAGRKPRERAEILRKSYELIMRDAERLAKLITLENGKALPDSRGEVAYAAEFFRWFAEEAVRNLGQVSRAPASGARILVQHKPAGVAVLVTPWNFPAAMATRKIGPALAAGCTVVLKPASDTPLTMLALMPILEEAGVPAGVVNVIPSRSSGKVVSTMLHDPRVRVISFTGSTEVGRKLLHEAADNVVRPAMELGGNAPFIVFEDADIDAAIEGAMIAKMRNMGEACTSANRFYVHEKVHDEFARKLTAKMAAFRMGNGLDEGVTLGPLVNAEARQKVTELVEDAVKKGAKVLTGGKPADGSGFFYPATVLDGVPDSADLLREEIFGPVAALQTFRSEDEVVRRANDTEYGLIAYLYTRDASRGLRVSERLDFGMIGLNRGLVSDPAAPFGGMKQSGIGREGAHEGLMEFLETQYVSLSW
jgi:succinate-semialdehyde dehydrogenase/glutarate-semialdehyde dehydrogenase